MEIGNYRPVANAEELSIGRRKLTFIETRMIHWPDSMFTYLNEDQILFSSDGFGQHYAGPVVAGKNQPLLDGAGGQQVKGLLIKRHSGGPVLWERPFTPGRPLFRGRSRRFCRRTC